MLKEFRDFAARGNVIDLAVGVIIGAAFGKVVTSVVNDLIMPPIGMALGRIDFSNLFVALDGGTYASLAQAKAATPPAPRPEARKDPEVPAVRPEARAERTEVARTEAYGSELPDLSGPKPPQPRKPARRGLLFGPRKG